MAGPERSGLHPVAAAPTLSDPLATRPVVAGKRRTRDMDGARAVTVAALPTAVKPCSCHGLAAVQATARNISSSARTTLRSVPIRSISTSHTSPGFM